MQIWPLWLPATGTSAGPASSACSTAREPAAPRARSAARLGGRSPCESPPGAGVRGPPPFRQEQGARVAGVAATGTARGWAREAAGWEGLPTRRARYHSDAFPWLPAGPRPPGASGPRGLARGGRGLRGCRVLWSSAGSQSHLPRGLGRGPRPQAARAPPQPAPARWRGRPTCLSCPTCETAETLSPASPAPAAPAGQWGQPHLPHLPRLPHLPCPTCIAETPHLSHLSNLPHLPHLQDDRDVPPASCPTCPTCTCAEAQAQLEHPVRPALWAQLPAPRATMTPGSREVSLSKRV